MPLQEKLCQHVSTRFKIICTFSLPPYFSLSLSITFEFHQWILFCLLCQNLSHLLSWILMRLKGQFSLFLFLFYPPLSIQKADVIQQLIKWNQELKKIPKRTDSQMNHSNKFKLKKVRRKFVRKYMAPNENKVWKIAKYLNTFSLKRNLKKVIINGYIPILNMLLFS